MANITAVIRAEKKKKDGTCPIAFRLYHKKNYFFSSGKSVKESYWDPDKRLVKASHPLSRELNNLIEAKLLAANKYIINCEASGSPINPDQIKVIISGKNPFSFYMFADKHLERVKQTNYTTFIKEQSIRNKLFNITGELLLSQVTPGKLEDVMIKLAGIPNNPNTVAKAIDYMRMIYNYAIREGATSPSLNPFNSIRVKREPAEKERLSKEEIKLLEDIRPSLTGMEKLACDMFLFSYYCMGMRFRDIYTFEKSMIGNGAIAYTMNKNRKRVYIPIHSKLQALISEYILLPGKYLFPLGQKEHAGMQQVYTSVSSRNAVFNRNLKFAALKAGITKQIHFHIARHSFADNLRKSGADPVTAMNAMQHSDISTTQKYFASMDKEGMKKVAEMIYGT